MCYPVSCKGFVPSHSEAPTPVKFFPYFQGTYLAVAASLNGGNVLEAFVKMVQQWFQTFGKYWQDTSVLTSCLVNNGMAKNVLI